MKFKKMIALATSLIMASALIISPIGNIASADVIELISNSTFSSGTTGWGIYKESGGSATLSTDSERLALNISSVGKVNHAVQTYYDIIPLYQNGVYHLSYEISSTVDRTINAMIQQNGGTYQSYTMKSLNLTSETQTIDYTFTMNAESDIMSKFVFNCGNYGKELGEHTIYLDNVVLQLVDDSKIDYSEIRAYEAPIVINQVGYKSDSEKIAVFREITDETEFSVINAETNEIVLTSELYGKTQNTSADEINYLGDFSEVTDPGSYYISCGNLDDSYTFTISDDLYTNLLDDTVRMLYLQRCGTAIEDTTFSHVACHMTKAKVYGTNEYIDVSGGWHDAGDYGRYVVPAAKTIADLLYAYDANPTIFNDNIGIPESGNGVPDILDEVRYDLEWLLKMQSESGGVYHKVTCENFPGYIMPEKETAELIVTPVSTTATADFCAAMAMAYEFYYDLDKDFAEECLSAAEKAWLFLEENPRLIFSNPTDISTGEYGDSSDNDERYWAVAQMYRATNDSKYFSALENMYARSGMDWSTVGDYGSIAILTMDEFDVTSSIYTKAKNSILTQAKTFLNKTASNPYGVAITSFNWGSNMTVGNAGVILGLASEITGDDSYGTAASSNLNYLLGKNPNSVCYVTGYGTVSPQNPHHRPSIAKSASMKGMLVGGVNSGKEDSAAKAYLSGMASAKCYIDHSESYSTNEVTTYWNSPLIYLLALTEKTTSSLKGDVNIDNEVSVSDIVLLQKYLVKAETLTRQQGLNADINDDSIVNVMDSCLLRRRLIQSSIPTKPDSTATVVADFRKGLSSFFQASDGWTNGGFFDCGWYAKNVAIKDNALNLTIDEDSTGKYNYSSAEYRTKSFYGYGYYETSMQAIKNDGVVSSFFTYTGPSDNNQWDEIDVEILGKDTTKVQFNYFTNGVGDNEYIHDLGFDASEGFHTYAFDWQSDHITWYIDGKEVYTANNDIPSTPGKIMMNVWPGTGVDGWLNPYDGKTPLTAKYQWVTYKSLS